ncbi:MAG: glycoside hydrolase family 76 protein [Verrucomicrobiota bacterium]
MPPAAQRHYLGGTAQFSIFAKGMNPMTYAWRKNGVSLDDGGNISGSKTNSLTITNLALTDAGDYTVVVTNSFGSVTSLVAHLEVAVETPADRAIDAFNQAYLIQTNNLTYYASSLTNRAPDGTWTMCLNIQGMQDAYERTGSPQHLQLVNSLLVTFLIQTPPPWSWDGWNDDIGWFSLALVRGYQMTGNANFLAQAEYGFNYAFGRGWDTNFNNGGIWEQQPEYTPPGQSISKEALSNDSLAQVACMLYQSTQNPVYLDRAQQIYAWVRTNIFNPQTGQVYAGIATNGVVNQSSALYNQGTFVDLANLLYRITGQQFYYDDALKAVEFTRNNLTVNGVFNNSASWINTWAAEFARGLGHFVRDNNLWSTYYPWMWANANAAWACRRTDLDIAWNQWTQPTPTNNMIANWAVNAVAMLQVTPTTQPGFINCTNQLSGP